MNPSLKCYRMLITAEKGWTADANALFEELAQGQILQTFIVGVSDNGIPLVNLFKIQGISVRINVFNIFIDLLSFLLTRMCSLIKNWLTEVTLNGSTVRRN